jgi:hypothetical protein
MSDIFEKRTDESFWQEKGGEGQRGMFGGHRGKVVKLFCRLATI